MADVTTASQVLVAESYGGRDEPVDTLVSNMVAVNIVPVFDALRVKELPTEGTYQARSSALYYYAPACSINAPPMLQPVCASVCSCLHLFFQTIQWHVNCASSSYSSYISRENQSSWMPWARTGVWSRAQRGRNGKPPLECARRATRRPAPTWRRR